jgi:hypothetical protein
MIRDSGSVKLYCALASGFAESAGSPVAAASFFARASSARLASRIRFSRLSRRCSSAGSSSPRRSAPYSASSAASVASAFASRSFAPQVLRGYRDFMAGAPDEVTGLAVMTTLPPSQHTPPEIHDTPFIVTAGVYAGDLDKGMKVMQPLRELGTHLADISGPIPFVGVQTAFDEFFQRQLLRSYWKSTYLSELTDEAIDLVADAAKERNSTRTLIALFSWGGAINRVGAEETAHAERSAQWMVSVDGNWHDPADDDTVITWVRERWAAIHKLGTGSTYLNFTGIADESTDVGVDSAFSRNLKRLAEIKKKYDPDNFFRLNNNIKPA